MDVCQRIETCPITRYFGKVGWQKFQKRYCEGDYQQCTRYKLAETGASIPEHLMPWDEMPEIEQP